MAVTQITERPTIVEQ